MIGRVRSVAVDAVAIAIYVASIYASSVYPLLLLWRIWAVGSLLDPIALALLLVFLTAAFVPLKWTVNAASRKFIDFSTRRGAQYFSTELIVDDAESLKPGKGLLIGFEPHSALPLALPMVFNTYSYLLPKELHGRTHAAASSICFKVPFVRQLWHWLGLVPVSKHVLSKLLHQGKAVALCPGGVQEVLLMEAGRETVYLTPRLGFVKLAMTHGVPLVPAFAFGQSATYTWYRPGPPWVPAAVIDMLSRRLGAAPLIMHGIWGSPMPHKVRMSVVLGKALQVPHLADPTEEQVREQLALFITAMQDLYERYKDRCGHGNEPLVVI